MLLIRSEDNNRDAVFVMAEETQAKRTLDKTELAFNEVGNTYFLSNIWVAGDEIGRELPKTRAERALEQGESQHLTKAVKAHSMTPCCCGSSRERAIAKSARRSASPKRRRESASSGRCRGCGRSSRAKA